MLRGLSIFITLIFINISLYAKDKSETYTLKGALTDAQKAQYEKWIGDVITALNGVGFGKKLEFNPTIVINEKKNAWPYIYTFCDENFYCCQPVKFGKDTITYYPIKAIPGLDNNEFAFKQLIANFIISNNIGKEIPYWFEKGLSSWVANKAGSPSWTERNYSYLIFLNTDRKETKSIEQIINFKYKFDNTERYLQEAQAWALMNWLMNQKTYLDDPKLILALSNLANKQSLLEVKNLNANWIEYLASNFLDRLPKEVQVSPNCKNVLDQEDLKGLFITIKKKNPNVSPDNIACMIGYTIHPTSFKNIIALVTDKQAIIREVAVQALGIIPDRSNLALLIEVSYSDPSKEVRYQSAKAISRLNMNIAPKELVNALSLEDPLFAGQAGASLATIGDTSTARNIIQKLGSVQSSTNSLEVTTTRNYIKDVNVVDGQYDPVIGTYQEGIKIEETILWVVELKANLILALNQLPLNHQAQTPELWYKWYSLQ